MAWPNLVDYNEALQNPLFCFDDSDLKNGQVAVDGIGLPLPCTGNFAAVYKVSDLTGDAWAVKCFVREVKGLQPRYQAISDHLRNIRQQVQLPFLVDFSYLSQGVRLQSAWYPVVKMRWVDGMPLNEFVRASLDKPRRLLTLAGMWLKLAQELRTAQMAHGDLQHGNVLLVTGNKSGVVRLALIDYDGMYVPALANRRSGEAGHANYQHPTRLIEKAYGPEIDRFSHLVICTVLHALAEKPSLWNRYNNDDNLLFREDDFKAPETSPLFHELWQLPASAARMWAGHLILAALASLDRVPSLDSVVSGGKVKPLASWQEEQIVALLASGSRRIRHIPRMKGTAKDTPVIEDESRLRIVDDDWLPFSPGQTATSHVSSAQPIAEPWWKAPVDPSLLGRAGNPRPNPKRRGKPALGKNLGQTKYVLTEHTDTVSCVAFSPDGHEIASASRDNTIKLWDAASGKLIRTFEGHSDGVESLAFSPDGKTLASGGSDGKVIVWDMQSLRELFTLKSHARDVNTLSYSSDGQRLASGGGELLNPGKIHIWNAAPGPSMLNLFGRRVQTLAGHKETITSVAFGPDGKLLASGSYDQTVIIWDTASGQPTMTMQGFSSSISCVRFSRDGKNSLAVTSGEWVILLNAATGVVLFNLGTHTEGASSAAFSPNGRWLASAGWDRLIKIWDIKTGQNIQTLSGHMDGILSIAVSPDSKWLASASCDCTVRVWRV